jgi:16S rRNA (guanine966-N2)-methyltransferase
MRIIAGKLGGRTIASPRTNRTHPMSDKVRGALFNALGDLSGLTMLDAYAGSGACSIEAVSRGADKVLAIDVDAAAIKTIAENVRALELSDAVTVKLANISGWSRNHVAEVFDVVLADPPYNDIRPDVLERLAVHVRPGGLYVLSWPGNEPTRDFARLEQISSKSYGDAQLVFYRRPD